MFETERKGRILIVDDDPGVRELLSQVLTEIGNYDTDVAADGMEGLEKIRSNRYDVIFTDLTMPRMNGMDFLRKSKEMDSSVPVIVLTGVSSMEIAVSRDAERGVRFHHQAVHAGQDRFHHGAGPRGMEAVRPARVDAGVRRLPEETERRAVQEAAGDRRPSTRSARSGPVPRQQGDLRAGRRDGREAARGPGGVLRHHRGGAADGPVGRRHRAGVLPGRRVPSSTPSSAGGSTTSSTWGSRTRTPASR